MRALVRHVTWTQPLLAGFLLPLLASKMTDRIIINKEAVAASAEFGQIKPHIQISAKDRATQAGDRERN